MKKRHTCTYAHSSFLGDSETAVTGEFIAADPRPLGEEKNAGFKNTSSITESTLTDNITS